MTQETETAPVAGPARTSATDPDVAREHSWLPSLLPPPPARLLDAGCGNGAVAGWLTGLGYRVTAIDADGEAVARARAGGVPAVLSDLAGFTDEPFDAVLMLLTLHHMHPLGRVVDRAARLLRRGGRLVIDEFAWDWADAATIRWFDDMAAILVAAGVADPAAGPLSPVGAPAEAGREERAGETGRWRARHTEHGTACNTGGAMIRAVSARFGQVEVRRVPYLARHLVSGQAQPAVLAELSRIERDRIADGTLTATGFRIVARQPRTPGGTEVVSGVAPAW